MLNVETVNIVVGTVLTFTLLFMMFVNLLRKPKNPETMNEKDMIEYYVNHKNFYFRYLMKILNLHSEEFSKENKRNIVDHLDRLMKCAQGRPFKIGCFEVVPIYYNFDVVAFKILGFGRYGCIENI